MAPSIVSETNRRIERMMNALTRAQIVRLYCAFFPGAAEREDIAGIDPDGMSADQVRIIRNIVHSYILQNDPGAERIAEILGRSQPHPVTGRVFYDPPLTPEEREAFLEAHRNRPPLMIPGPSPRPTMELPPELWSALGRLLNPANLQEEFASAILRGDMDTAGVLFDRLQDEGLTR